MSNNNSNEQTSPFSFKGYIYSKDDFQNKDKTKNFKTVEIRGTDENSQFIQICKYFVPESQFQVVDSLNIGQLVTVSYKIIAVGAYKSPGLFLVSLTPAK